MPLSDHQTDSLSTLRSICEGDKDYAQDCDQQKAYALNARSCCSCGMGESIYAVLESLTERCLARLLVSLG
jgi:hypothetical protein